MEIDSRFRRLRQNQVIRDLVSETQLHRQDLVQAVFLEEGGGAKSKIASLPGVFRYDVESALKHCEALLNNKINAVALFPAILEEKKDPLASQAVNEKGFYAKAIRKIKQHFPELCIFADVALDPYSSDGHDGLLKDGDVVNDESVDLLSQMAVILADAGADFVAPSDMMDGRVKAIRRCLDQAGFINTGILSYAVKYASHFYGPFRDALKSAPKAGDKKSYQMDAANQKEAIKEALQDEKEGADILMLKPASMYLDVVNQMKQRCALPLAAYHVSGELAMLKFAAQQGCFDYEAALFEKTLCIKRAGADLIFTYAALDLIKQI